MAGKLFLVLITTALINNVVLSQFLGICPFLGVSKSTKTAAGMGGAVIFVITLSSLVSSALYKYVIVKLHLEYLKTIIFIVVIAFLVQLVERIVANELKVSPAELEPATSRVPMRPIEMKVFAKEVPDKKEGE